MAELSKNASNLSGLLSKLLVVGILFLRQNREEVAQVSSTNNLFSGYDCALNRNPQLDLLRGIAVLMVIGFHYHYDPIFDRIGWAGVDLFFVLSGFLISGLLYSEAKRTGSISVGRFYLRRGFKIYPSFYFFLAITAMAMPLIRHRINYADLLFLQSYITPTWIHTWSLAVEEHFYIVLPPVLLLLINRRLLSYIPLISAFLLVMCLALRSLAYYSRAPFESIAYPSHLRIDALFVGVALGYLFHFRREFFNQLKGWRTLMIAAIGISPIALLHRAQWFMLTVGLGLVAIGFASLLAWIMNHSSVRFRLVEQIGEHSYSIYLWHYLVLQFFRGSISFWVYPVYVIACISVGIAMCQIVEFPMLRLRDRFFSRTKVGATNTALNIPRPEHLPAS